MLTTEIRSRIEPKLKDEAQAVLGRVGTWDRSGR